jgi:hypothetical protein
MLLYQLSPPRDDISRMTKGMTKPECFSYWFVIRHQFGVRHSCFVISFERFLDFARNNKKR